MASIERVSLHEMAQERYLNYALSVITSRALPDVRDGQKPVQRRILYGMNQLRLTPEARYRKSAQVVGEVMGKYHPHGDSAIYDAMVRMAQAFSLRYPLVDGQGNFGSMDGDGAAAMRYTEAKLTSISGQLMEELGQETVPFRPNYDGTQEEPVVMPAALPAVLLNGATGIAVGMATNIPPHNLRELVDACVALIEDPEMPIEKLVGMVPAPDFPTGGRILNSRAELLEIYETGHGSVEVRGEYEVQKDGRRQQIIVTSVPYAVNKAHIVEKIADAIGTGKVPQLVDVRDESTDQVRVVLDLKQGADAEAAMAYLFKHTPLQNRFHVNMTCLVPTENEQVGRPERLGLKEILRYFLDFRFEVVTRRLQYMLRKLEERIHILEGFRIIFDALDEAIRLIRESRDKKNAAERLMERFALSEIQTEAILEMRLYKLAQLEIEKILSELKAKEKEARKLRKLLKSEPQRWALISEELQMLREQYGDARRSVVGGPDEALDYSEENYIVEEDVFVCITRDGWMKRQKSYSDLSTIRVRDGDELGWVLMGSTRRSLILFTDRGRAYTMRVDGVPSTTGYGEPVQRHFDFEDGERIVGAALDDPRIIEELAEGEAEPRQEEGLLVMAVTRAGQVVSMELENFESVSTVNGRLFVRLQDEATGSGESDGVVDVSLYRGGEAWVSVISRKGRALTFDANEVPALKRAGKGVRAIALDEDDVVLGFGLTESLDDGVSIETARGRQEVISPRRYPPVGRGSRGRFIVRRGKIERVLRPTLEVKVEESADDEDSGESDSVTH